MKKIAVFWNFAISAKFQTTRKHERNSYFMENGNSVDKHIEM